MKLRNESVETLEMTDTPSDMPDSAAVQAKPTEDAPSDTSPETARRAGSRSKSQSAVRKPSKTFGQVVRKARQDLRLTQRELAEKLGVKPAHIAYLELDRRRPSLPLLARIAEILGLDREMMISLSHPEAKPFMNARKDHHAPVAKDQVWKDFTGNRHLLARHKVTGNEMKVLSQVNLLGKISAPRNFLFILNSIRQAQEEEQD
jgi:transcriptional regulator with XRE-family HTH domain